MPSPADHLFHLDELVRWGCTRHGLARGGAANQLLIGGHPWPMTNQEVAAIWDFTAGARRDELGNTHLLRMPGIPPLDMTPEHLASELAEGRAWQNYALISGQRMGIFGHALNGGWVCIDPAGARWLIQPTGALRPNSGSVSAGGSLTLNFDVRPFGYLGEATADPVARFVTLSDLGQASPAGISVPNGSSVALRLASIASHGRQAIIALYPSTFPLDVRDMPYGFLLLTFAGDGPEFGVTLEVLRTRTQTLGTRVMPDVVTLTRFYVIPTFEAISHSVETDAFGNIVAGQGVWQISGYTKSYELGPWATTTFRWFDDASRTEVTSVHGRVIGLVFDAADSIVEMTADWDQTIDYHYPAPAISFSGTISGSGPSRWIGNRSPEQPLGTFTGGIAMTIDLERRVNYDVSVTLRRNGLAVSTYAYSASSEATQTDVYNLGGTPYPEPAFEWEGDYLRSSVRYDCLTGSAAGVVTGLSGIGAPRPEDTAYIPTQNYTRSRSIGFDGSAPIYNESGPGSAIGINTPTNPLIQRVELNWLANSGTPYLRFDYAVQRLSNNLWAPRWERYITSTTRDYAKAPLAISPHGEAVNDTAGSDWSDRTRLIGSYHPVTHAIHATFDWQPTNITDSCWV